MFIFRDVISLLFAPIDPVEGSTLGLVSFVQPSAKFLEVLVQRASGVGPVVQTLCQSIVSSKQLPQLIIGEATPTPDTQGAAQRSIALYSEKNLLLVSGNSAVS